MLFKHPIYQFKEKRICILALGNSSAAGNEKRQPAVWPPFRNLSQDSFVNYRRVLPFDGP
jgi:hypothetical protein